MLLAVIVSANKVNKKLTSTWTLEIHRHSARKRNSSRGSFFVPDRLFQSIERSGPDCSLTDGNPIAPSLIIREGRLAAMVSLSPSQVQD